MKLRIRGNSLRLRLQKSEVKKLFETGLIEEKISFGTNQLVYAIEASSEEKIFSALSENRITVKIPQEIIHNWASTELVSLTEEQDVNGEKLFLLIEKDFFCLKPRTAGQEEDESDAYKNPNESCGHAAH